MQVKRQGSSVWSGAAPLCNTNNLIAHIILILVLTLVPEYILVCMYTDLSRRPVALYIKPPARK